MGKQPDDEPVTLPLTQARNARKLLLLVMAPSFAAAKFTAGQATQFFQATADLLAKSKQDRPDGGLESFWESVYNTPDLPVGMIERALVEGMRDSMFRENLLRVFHDVAAEIEESFDSDASIPSHGGLGYREWLCVYFATEALRKEAHKTKHGSWKSKWVAWPKHSDILNEDDDVRS